MKLRTYYTLLFTNSIPDGLRLPIAFDIDGWSLRVLPVEGIADRADAVVECPVDPSSLTLETGPEPIGEGETIRGLDAPERAQAAHYLSEVTDLLSFLTDAPIRYSHKLGRDELVADSLTDEKALAAFPTQTLHESLHVQSSTRIFSPAELTQGALDHLLAKNAGLALYAQALRTQDQVAAFREYWRVLESAFALIDDDLVNTLAQYPPAQQLGFSHDEIRGLCVLRGRASHAQSRAGIKEVRSVVADTGRQLARLKCLTEQVILTKATWGVRTQATTPLAPIRAYVDKDGRLVLAPTE